MLLIGYTFSHKIPQTPGTVQLECFQEMKIVFKTVKKAYEYSMKYLVKFREFQEIENYDVTKDFEVFTDKDFEMFTTDLDQDFDVIVTKPTCLDIITIEKVYAE